MESASLTHMMYESFLKIFRPSRVRLFYGLRLRVCRFAAWWKKLVPTMAGTPDDGYMNENSLS
jgi:hypothetical protein